MTTPAEAPSIARLERHIQALEAELLRVRERVADAETRADRAEKAARDAWQFAKWMSSSGGQVQSC